MPRSRSLPAHTSNGIRMSAVWVSQFRPEFSEFLFSPVGDDGNGMLLSVLSALARLNVDPWQEAAELAKLPRETAIQRLAVLLSTLPDGVPGHQNHRAIAAALIALLPASGAPSLTSSIAAAAVTKRSSLVVLVMLLLAVMLCAKYIDTSSQPSASGVRVHAPVTGTGSPIHRSART